MLVAAKSHGALACYGIAAFGAVLAATLLWAFLQVRFSTPWWVPCLVTVVLSVYGYVSSSYYRPQRISVAMAIVVGALLGVGLVARPVSDVLDADRNLRAEEQRQSQTNPEETASRNEGSDRR